MELKLNIDHEQILDILQQFPDEEVERIFVMLQARMVAKRDKKVVQSVILAAPTWSEQDWSEYEQARASINQSK